MPTLLDIPRELRDKILDLAIAVHNSPRPYESIPIEPPRRGLFIQDRRHNVKYKNFIGTDIIPTLLVNRKIRDETLAAVNRIPSKHNFELDALLFKERELRATWLSVPALTTRVDNVRATFRIEGINKGDSRDHSIFSGNGGPGVMTWWLYTLLENFVRVGPAEDQVARDKKFDRSISIKTLELDVRTPDVPEEMMEPNPRPYQGGYRSLQRLRQQTGIDYVMRPSYLASYIHSDISSLVRMTYHTARYGGILYERIGNIKVLIDGNPYSEWDMTKLLALVRFDNSFGEYPAEEREKAFKRWKLNAYKKRRKLGLPVLTEDEVEGDMQSNWGLFCHGTTFSGVSDS